MVLPSAFVHPRFRLESTRLGTLLMAARRVRFQGEDAAEIRCDCVVEPGDGDRPEQTVEIVVRRDSKAPGWPGSCSCDHVGINHGCAHVRAVWEMLDCIGAQCHETGHGSHYVATLAYPEAPPAGLE